MGRGGRLLVMLLMTFFFFVVEIVFGYVSHSMALIADSFHMLSDVMALAIAYGCLKVFLINEMNQARAIYLHLIIAFT